MKRTWQKSRVDRMLVDHLLRTGNYAAAQQLSDSSGVEVGSVYVAGCILVSYGVIFPFEHESRISPRGVRQRVV